MHGGYGGMMVTGKLRYLEKNLLQYHFPYNKPHMDCPMIEYRQPW
jgi:hypothetical protein